MKHHYNLETFLKEDAISYYLLGAFCTDGCVILQPRNRGNAKIDSNDADWLKSIASTICKTTTVRKDKRSQCFKIEFYSIDIVNWLVSHGCSTKKSLTLKFPEVPNKYLADFIRGCWDGDGSLGLYNYYRKDRDRMETKRGCALATSSLVFAEAMRRALISFSVKSSIRKLPMSKRQIGGRAILNTTPSYQVQIQDKKSILHFCENIYYKNSPLFMGRKNEVAKILMANCALQ